MTRNSRYAARALVAGGLVSVASAALVACGGSDGEAVSVEAPPAAPPAPLLADRIAARTHYFGAENVDAATGEIRKDLVILSWASNTTYAAAVNGNVVLLDAALLRREEVPGRTPTTLTELVGLMPSHIVLGKASAGHADLAANIAFRTGATVIGAQEHCDVVEADARRQQGWSGNARLLHCMAVFPKDEAVGTGVAVLDLPDLELCLRAVKHTDLAASAADPTLPFASFDWSLYSDARDMQWWPTGVAASDGVSTSGSADGPSVAYHLTLGAGRGFGVFWNDRAGSLTQLAPAAGTLMRSLPKTDVHVGSVDVANATTNGLRDAAQYIQAVQPKVFFASGHDAASQRGNAFNTGELMRRALETAIDNVGITSPPEVRVNFDPTDYLRPHYMTFDPAAAGWQQPGDKAATASCT